MGTAVQAGTPLPTSKGFHRHKPWSKGCQRTPSAHREGGQKCHSHRALLADVELQEEVRERTDTQREKGFIYPSPAPSLPRVSRVSKGRAI